MLLYLTQHLARWYLLTRTTRHQLLLRFTSYLFMYLFISHAVHCDINWCNRKNVFFQTFFFTLVIFISALFTKFLRSNYCNEFWGLLLHLRQLLKSMVICNGHRLYLLQSTVLHGVVPFWYSTRPVTCWIRFCLNTPPPHSSVQFPSISSQSVKSEKRIKRKIFLYY